MAIDLYEARYRAGPFSFGKRTLATVEIDQVVHLGYRSVKGKPWEYKARYLGLDTIEKYRVPLFSNDNNEEYRLGTLSEREVEKDNDTRGRLRWRYDFDVWAKENKQIADRELEELHQSVLEDLVAVR